MSLKTQAKVLRTLEEQRFTPVGSDEPVTVDVRVIASTNKDLGRRNFARQFSRRSFLPTERDSLLGAAAARTQRRHSACLHGTF